jgi:tripartite-type tricarboxylate transporter receptor subunit TctC
MLALIVCRSRGSIVKSGGKLMGKGSESIIENISGADGGIGAGRVARARPDGYTIELVSSDVALVVTGGGGILTTRSED